MMSYFVRSNEHEEPKGPFELDVITEQIRRGWLTSDATVAEPGAKTWTPISAIPALASELARQPQQPNLDPALDAALSRTKGKYKNGYSVSRTVRASGLGYKVLGGMVAVVGVLAGLSMGGYISFMVFGGGFVAGAVLFGIGVAIEAMGETLAALLDTAVHTRVALEKPPGK